MIPPDRRRSISPCLRSSSSKLNLRDFVAICLHSGRRLVNNDMLSMVEVDKAQGEVFEMMRSDFHPPISMVKDLCSFWKLWPYNIIMSLHKSLSTLRRIPLYTLSPNVREIVQHLVMEMFIVVRAIEILHLDGWISRPCCLTESSLMKLPTLQESRSQRFQQHQKFLKLTIIEVSHHDNHASCTTWKTGVHLNWS